MNGGVEDRRVVMDALLETIGMTGDELLMVCRSQQEVWTVRCKSV